jgi:DNA-directed RNA polymerase specialized sigma24 family protein
MNANLTITRRRAAPRRAPRLTATTGGRERVAAALARRGARERLVLALLLYERLFPVEVADALHLSVRQVERTYDALLAELRRSLGRPSTRDRARLTAGSSRVRKAA